MSDFNRLVDQFAARIMHVAAVRNYPELTEIMADLGRTGSTVQILGKLYGRLPGSTLAKLLLSDLRSVSGWSGDDWDSLLTLACGNEVAMYDLDRFLLMYGGLDYETRSTIWAGRYGNIARGVQVFKFAGSDLVLHAEGHPALELIYQRLDVGELKDFQESLGRKMQRSRAG